MTIQEETPRILIIDDNQSIHDDFEKILISRSAEADAALEDLESKLFENVPTGDCGGNFRIEHAYQGKDGYEMVRKAREEGEPFALAFVDIRMPPGWDGIETVEHIYQTDDAIQIVLCTAYSDHSWRNIATRVGPRDGLLILKKPFDAIEVMQSAHALTRKWFIQRATENLLQDLEGLVRERTEQLEKEIEERQKVESEFRLSQKLESIGQLAAGIAHEINTPIQYIGDNTHFLRGVFGDLIKLIEHYQRIFLTLETHNSDIGRQAKEVEEEIDLEFIQEQIPQSLNSSMEGIKHVTNIVHSLKEFAHPAVADKSPSDINRSIQNTITVARNEYKYVAEVELDLGEIPLVMCHPGDVNQALLNIVVNAAHAVANVVGDGGEKGQIRIRSFQENDEVVIEIADTGGGIPDDIAARVFDPFFTTKGVGKGTGQGLAITRGIIIEKHGGKLDFDSQPGKGTTFRMRLPIEGLSLEE